MTPNNSVDAVFTDLFHALEQLGRPYIIGGSVATSLYGQPRQTNDIDLVLDLPSDCAQDAFRCFGASFHASLTDIESAITGGYEYPAFQLLHGEQYTKVDVFIKQPGPFADSAFQRRVMLGSIANVDAWFYSREDIALQKILWYRLGNKMSDRQWNDLVQVIEVQAEKFDRVYFLEWADRLDIRELADQALAEAWD